MAQVSSYARKRDHAPGETRPAGGPTASETKQARMFVWAMTSKVRRYPGRRVSRRGLPAFKQLDTRLRGCLREESKRRSKTQP